MLRRPRNRALAVAWIAVSCSVGPSATLRAEPPGPPAWSSSALCLTPAPTPGPEGLYVSNTWPGGVVYYQFNANVTQPQRQLMLNAWAMLSATINLQFVPRTTEPNYIEVSGDVTPTCGASFSNAIGMTGSAQAITICINHWGWPGLLMHETMHALGLWHEQQRPDRDQYVQINFAAVAPGFAGNYGIPTATAHGPYDFASIMHYDQIGFSAKGDRTITVKPPYRRQWQHRIGTYIGPAGTLSSGDLWVLKQMYGGNPRPRAFSLTSPAQGTAVGPAWIPSFVWQASEAATSYRLQVDETPLFATPEIDVQVATTSYMHLAPLLPFHLYWWRVIASNAQGATEAFPLSPLAFYTRGAYPPMLFVDDSAPPGGDGLAWSTAIRDLALALETAVASSGAVAEVFVAQGTYKPAFGSTDRELSFWLPDACAVRGGFAGFGAPDPNARDIDAFPTVLSGDLLGNDQPGFVNYDDNSNHVVYSMFNPASTLLEGFTIRAGHAVIAPINAGGGLVVDGGNPTIRRCFFTGGEGTVGGGVAVIWSNATPTLDRCRFEGNRAPQWIGGAILGQASGAFRIDHCTFSGNVAGSAAAIGLYFGKPTIVNSVFAQNSATVPSGEFAGGGAIGSFNTSLPTIVNCTVVANTSAAPGGAVIDDPTSTTTIANSILWGNTPDQHAGGPTILFSNVQGGAPGVGNINAAPVYVNTGPHPYALAQGSPGIDASTNFMIPKDILTDAAGNPRFIDQPCIPDIGIGPGPVADIGAYERQPCYPDCNNDCALTVADFGCFQTQFVAGNPYADCNADTTLTVADFGCFQTRFVAGCP